MAGRARWEHFRHEADVGVRGIGPDVAQAFEQGALALTAAITDPGTVRPSDTVRLELQCADPELLFNEWLNAVVYEMATRRMLFSRFKVWIHDGHLVAEAAGEPVVPERHHPAVEVKGATLTELMVSRRPDGSWLAQCVVDV
jgi:SHS2 domain-containing protein